MILQIQHEYIFYCPSDVYIHQNSSVSYCFIIIHTFMQFQLPPKKEGNINVRINKYVTNKIKIKTRVQQSKLIGLGILCMCVCMFAYHFRPVCMCVHVSIYLQTFVRIMKVDRLVTPCDALPPLPPTLLSPPLPTLRYGTGVWRWGRVGRSRGTVPCDVSKEPLPLMNQLLSSNEQIGLKWSHLKYWELKLFLLSDRSEDAMICSLARPVPPVAKKQRGWEKWN